MTDLRRQKEYSRRDFLKTSGAVTSGIIGGSLLGGLVGFNLEGLNNEANNSNAVIASETDDSAIQNLEEARMFFQRKEDFEILSLATELIFPEDDNGPGAIGLGVPYFIDRQLSGNWGINDRMYMDGPFQEDENPLTMQEAFIEGLRKIESVSQEEFDTSFIELEEENQISLLEEFESDEIEMELINSSDFFQILRNSTLEGAYADPLYGGNKNMEGWKMKEYPGAQLSYRHLMTEDYQADAEYIVIEPMSLSDQ